MKTKSWIILGFIGIVIGVVAPALLAFDMMHDIQSAGPFAGQGHPQQSMSYFPIYGAVSQIFFWGGIISTAFGLIKFYKDKPQNP